MIGLQTYLRPSGAGRWSNCLGFPALAATVGTEDVDDDGDNEVREDGTACHWLADQVWTGDRPSVGSLSPNNREITDEMYAAVDEYHALLRSWTYDPHLIAIEQQIPVSQFFPGVSDGTPDAFHYAHLHNILHVGDLKFGYRPVEEWRNRQMIIYAWTLVCMLTKQGHAPQEIRLTIVQPRCPHRNGTTRTWIVDVNELGNLAAELAAKAQACYAPNPQCVAGPHCYECPVAAECQSLKAAAGSGMEVAYDATPFVLNEVELGYELSKLMQAQAHIENRINGLSTQAESLIRKGRTIPGFGLTRSVRRWRWRNPECVQRLGELFGVEVMDEPKIKSVPKLRDAFPVDVQALYAEQPVGELKLRMADPNEAIKAFTRRK